MDEQQTPTPRRARHFVRSEVTRDMRRSVERAARSQDISVSKWVKWAIAEKLTSIQKAQESL